MNCLKRFLAPYKLLRSYWSAYGGYQALLCSPYFLLSLLLSICITLFGSFDQPLLAAVFEKTFLINPSLLGFTLAGLTVFLGVGDERFRDAIRGETPENNKPSPFIVVFVSFMHFTLIQILALLNAVIGGFFFLSEIRQYVFFSLWLFLYSILLVVAAILAVYQLAQWYDKAKKAQPSKEASSEIIPYNEPYKLFFGEP
jgi:hypothetical protein